VAGSVPGMAVRFVIVGAGPAGVQAATTAARLGAEITLVERDVIGGAANLWDCIPSKAMIATGAVMSLTGRARSMGLRDLAPGLDLVALRERVETIERGLASSFTAQL
jgi:pyruvate/2-oxoglutarate dehydrogenase complex dihydrolipoamide dehydrogenase (E3) component